LPLWAQTPAPAAPPEAPAASSQALALLQQKDYAAALPLYEKALAQAPDRAELWNEYTVCLKNLRRLPAAARAGWRAIQLDQGRASQLWYAQASVLLEGREWKAAQACLEKVESLHKDRPFVARAWLNLAFRMMAAGVSEGVVDHCQRAARLDPENSLAWLDLGQAQAFTGAAKEAVASLEKGKALAEAQKDAQRADYASILLRKAQAGESVRPLTAPGNAWQTLPAALVRRPEGDPLKLALPAQVDHHYTLADGSVLTLTAPEGWSEALGKDRQDNQFSVHFASPGLEGFKVLFSPLSGVGNPLGVQATAKGVAKDLLANSVEKELPLKELSTPTVKGWWVFSTDKSAPSGIPVRGQYRHLLSAQLDVDGQQCVGTVLTNDSAPTIVEAGLAIFSSARRAGAPAKN
jgi:tetratricopeptide (TPR) repeat protein